MTLKPGTTLLQCRQALVRLIYLSSKHCLQDKNVGQICVVSLINNDDNWAKKNEDDANRDSNIPDLGVPDDMSPLHSYTQSHIKSD